MQKNNSDSLDEIEMSRALLLARRHEPPRNKYILVQRISAVFAKDLVEAFLYFFGARDLFWKDQRGRIQKFNRVIIPICRLAVDGVIWPFLYIKHRYSAFRYSSFRPAEKKPIHNITYLRTDHVFDSKGGGAIAHMCGVINSFIKAGHPVSFFSTDKIPALQDSVSFVEVVPDYIVGRNIPNMPSIEYTDQLFQAVVSHHGTEGPSFFYQRYSLGNYAGVLLKDHYKVPYVCEFNGPLLWIERNWGGRKKIHEGLLQHIEDMNVKAADLVVVVSEPLATIVEGKGVPRDRILVNPNGVDIDKFHPEISGEEIRKSYGLQEKLVIGFIGSFGAWHGAEILAEAFGILGKTGALDDDQYRLLMIGDGNTMEEVKAQLHKYSVMDKVVLTGTVQQVQASKYLAACDILVSPHVRNTDGSPFFGSPTKLFEYMAMGRGIIASDLEQIGEILEHDKTAVLVPPNDANALSEGIARLLEDEKLRNNLGAAARAEVVKKYTWQHHAERIINALY